VLLLKQQKLLQFSSTTKFLYFVGRTSCPVGKIAEKAVCRSVLSLWWFCPLGSERAISGYFDGIF